MVQNARSAKITKRVVHSLAPEDARYTLWDTQLKGFGIRVATSDIKTYVVRYRTTEGAERLIQIAGHGVVTAEEARERAAAVLADVAAGGEGPCRRCAPAQFVLSWCFAPIYMIEW